MLTLTNQQMELKISTPGLDLQIVKLFRIWNNIKIEKLIIANKNKYSLSSSFRTIGSHLSFTRLRRLRRESPIKPEERVRSEGSSLQLREYLIFEAL